MSIKLNVVRSTKNGHTFFNMLTYVSGQNIRKVRLILISSRISGSSQTQQKAIKRSSGWNVGNDATVIAFCCLYYSLLPL